MQKKLRFFLSFDFMQNERERESVWWSFRKKKNKNFIDYRNVDIKSPQICIFEKGLVHGFCKKLRFCMFFSMQNASKKKCLVKF